MKVHVVFFGQLEELTACKEMVIEQVNTTDELQAQLISQFPKLADFDYLLAQNQEIVKSNRDLSENDELALLPPFAGG